MDKIKLTETQMLAFDLVLGSAIRLLIGTYNQIAKASDEELKKMKLDIDEKYKTSLDKIKAH